jgi:hypothetical protein
MFWQRRTGQTLTDEDARQIVANVSGFFDRLQSWSRSPRSRASSANERHGR